MAPTYTYKGHVFNSEAELADAKKENEAIEYLKSRTDMNDAGMVLKLYNKLIERKLISTPIGVDFLNELRSNITASGIITENKLKPVPEIKKSAKVRQTKKKTSPLVLKLRRQNYVLKLVVIILASLVIGMFIIVLTGKLSPIRAVYEEQILNEYSSWQKDLTKKEKEVNDKLYFLEQYGIYFEEDSENTENTK